MKIRKLITAGIIGALTVLTLTCTAFAGQWVRDGNGWWFQNSDGSYPKNGMYTIGGEDYVFDSYGYMKENQWTMVNNRWYYVTGTGAVAKNTWIGGTYYVGSDGIMLTNTWTPDGYWVDAQGAWDPSKKKGQENTVSKEYYTIDGSWDNRDQAGYNDSNRVDMWIDIQPGDAYLGTMDFGLYMSSGTPYSLYDKQNPNGDSLAIATVDGLNWGCRSTITNDWYDMTYNGKDTITLKWRSTSWGGGTMTFKRRSGGSLMSTSNSGSSSEPEWSDVYDDELYTKDIHGGSVG